MQFLTEIPMPIHFHFFLYLSVSMHALCACACLCAHSEHTTVHVWRPGDNLWESVLPFHHGGPRGGAQVFRSDVKFLYPLRHLTGPWASFLATNPSNLSQESLPVSGSTYHVDQQVRDQNHSHSRRSEATCSLPWYTPSVLPFLSTPPTPTDPS